jgi:hypothetical protein
MGPMGPSSRSIKDLYRITITETEINELTKTPRKYKGIVYVIFQNFLSPLQGHVACEIFQLPKLDIKHINQEEMHFFFNLLQTMVSSKFSTTIKNFFNDQGTPLHNIKDIIKASNDND